MTTNWKRTATSAVLCLLLAGAMTAPLASSFGAETDPIPATTWMGATPAGQPTETDVSRAEGLQGQALQFDGEKSVIDTRLSAADTEKCATWSAWVLPTKTGGRRQILCADAGSYGRSILIDNGRFGIFTGKDCWTPATADEGQWQHVAVVFGPDKIRFYKNGAEFVSDEAPGGQTGSLMIGAHPQYGDHFAGLMDQIAVFNEALSAEQIERLHATLAGSASRAANITTHGDTTRVATAVPDGIAWKSLQALLVDGTAWPTSNAGLPGSWHPISVTPIKETWGWNIDGPLWGARPKSVFVHFEGGKLVRVEIIWIEVGLVMGWPKAALIEKEASAMPMGPARVKRFKEADIVRAEEVKTSRKDFDDQMKAALEIVPKEIAAATASAGKKDQIGRNNLMTKVTEFGNASVLIRLTADPKQMVSATVLRQTPAPTQTRLGLPIKAAQTPTPTPTPLPPIGQSLNQPHTPTKRDNVTIKENGDMFIENIPMIPQGARAYCMSGVLAMVMQYHGLPVSMETYAGKITVGDHYIKEKGFSDFAPVYDDAAKAAHLRHINTSMASFQKVEEAIRKGEPVIVFRFIRDDRLALQSQWRDAVAKDPNFRIPNPKAAKERAQWPSRQKGDGGHASIITGCNRQRGDVFLTESWGGEDGGNGNRNRRMSFDELSETAYHFSFFER